MNILVFGATGMLGSKLVSILRRTNNNIYTTSSSRISDNISNHHILDLNNVNEIQLTNLITSIKPNVIINCAALIDVNYCNDNPIHTFEINSTFIYKLIKIITNEIKIIHISSDAVFSDFDLSREVNSNKSPSSIYGLSKHLAELYLQKFSKNFIIVRTTLVGSNPKNNVLSFTDWITEKLNNASTISLYNNVYFSPIDVETFSQILINNVIFSSQNGIFHVVSKSPISRYDFGIMYSKKRKLNTELIVKIDRDKDNSGRALNQYLNPTISEETLKFNAPNIEEVINNLMF